MATQTKDDAIDEEYEELGWADADRQAAEDIAREAQAIEADSARDTNRLKYLLPFGHMTSDRQLYEKSLKAFPTGTLFEKDEYEKWLTKQIQETKESR